MARQHSSSSLMMQHSIWLTIRQIVGPTLWTSLGLCSLISVGHSSLAWAMAPDGKEASLTDRSAQVFHRSVHPDPVLQSPRSQIYASSTLLFVNPQVGDDGAGEGSQRSPLRTLTHALAVAESGAVVVLSPGVYSEATGEQFPIQLKSGVTVQGDPSNLGDGILLQGGGRFLSPTFAGQDVTLLGADEAVLMGVTITNPNSRGYGLWIESTSPTVARNTFSHSIHDGVSITGDSQPTIQGNHFYRNGANGITIYGTSQPNVQGNVFEETGFGINMGQKAAPRLMDNRIWNNRSGIVIQGEAQPLLRRNVVEFNEQDGLVAIAQSRPDLGLEDDPGQNRFSDNGQSDINAEVAVHPIISIGNTLDLNHVIGQVRTTMPPVRIASQPTRSSQEAPPLPPTESLSSESIPFSALRAQEHNDIAEAAGAEAARPESVRAEATDVEVEAEITDVEVEAKITDPEVEAEITDVEVEEADVTDVEIAEKVEDVADAETGEDVAGDRSILDILAAVPSPSTTTRLETSSNTLSRANVRQEPQSLEVNGPSVPDLLDSDTITTGIVASDTMTSEAEEELSTVPEQADIPDLEEGAIEIPITFLGEERAHVSPDLLAIQSSAPAKPDRTNNVVPSNLAAERPSSVRIPGEIESPQRPVAPAAVSPSAALPSAALPSVAIAPTPESSRSISPISTTPPDNLLPVPGTLVPEGHLGNLSTLPAHQTALNTALLATVPFNPTSTRINSLRYRVLVEVSTHEARSLVNSMVPDAFFTQVDGRPMMQIGAYNQLDNANDIAYRLLEQGLQVEVRRID